MFYFLSLTSALFAVGLFGFMSCRNARGKLISLFVQLNAIILGLAGFDNFVKNEGSLGQIFLVLVLIILTAYFLIAACFWRFTFKRNRLTVDDSLKILE
jgi:NADH-quinone oxidoreductase subunit K